MEEKIKQMLKQLRLNESLISTVLGILVVLTVGVLLYNYFSSRPTAEVPDLELNLGDQVSQPIKPGEVQEGETPKGLPQTHTVSRGDHLWSISERYYGSGYNWVDIASENNLSRPDQIEVGMELSIPDIAAKQQTISPRLESTQPSESSISDTSYTVQAGDTLWIISVRAYSDGYRWSQLYEANRDKIGPNPNQIEIGIQLTIPRN